MAATISTKQLYRNPLWSDLTIKYGNESIPGHKIVLGQRSNETKTIKFDDDADSFDALDAMILYMYTFQYTTHNRPRRNDWRFYLELADVANKYGLSELKRNAILELGDRKFSKPDILADMLLAIPTYCEGDEKKSLEKAGLALEREHILSLLQVPIYVDSLSHEQRSLQLKQLAAALAGIRSWIENHWGKPNAKWGLSVVQFETILMNAQTLPQAGLLEAIQAAQK
ncbi:hypothetical protein LTR10_006657 [Elasticomyces elasticus]|nr:hypothetical protein LTR10_006657 [Elasticomyces elasticus]KAK4972942.1 hypothetical protein LTR42_006236 [Elasticomyces elasticus]